MLSFTKLTEPSLLCPIPRFFLHLCPNNPTTFLPQDTAQLVFQNPFDHSPPSSGAYHAQDSNRQTGLGLRLGPDGLGQSPERAEEKSGMSSPRPFHRAPAHTTCAKACHQCRRRKLVRPHFPCDESYPCLIIVLFFRRNGSPFESMTLSVLTLFQ